jgi:hypothetical protein
LPRRTIAQKDDCQETIAHTLIDQKYDIPYKKFPSKGPSTRAILRTNH